MATLTFDDGPDPDSTPRVLDALGRAGAPAVFFVMADRALRQPALVERTLNEGHRVELHCRRHLRHTESARAEIERDADEALALLHDLGLRPERWRPPWGALAPWTAGVAATRGLELTGWTLDAEDWDGSPAAELLTRIAPRLDDDPVVLLHDGIGPGARRANCGETVALIEPLVERLRAAGNEPAPLADRHVPVPWPR